MNELSRTLRATITGTIVTTIVTQTEAGGRPASAQRERLVVTGIVQGVGFRPHVARTARRHGLVGSCRNSSTAVTIEVQGPTDALAAFAADLVDQAPPMARVLSVTREVIPSRAVEAGGRAAAGRESEDEAGPEGFRIEDSAHEVGGRTLVPPDVATCDDCVRELRDPNDPRYLHPFITCTNCGPRLTIIGGLPYDRPATSMASFPTCRDCAAQYADPQDRRYHAQPIACPQCGPALRLLTPAGQRITAGREPFSVPGIVARVRDALLAGQVVAIRGIGGFHLAVDARREDAVALLRARKHRPDQPFALMARDLPTAESIVEVGHAARSLLLDPARPIVVLPRRATQSESQPVTQLEAPVSQPELQLQVAQGVAPGLGELGVMLPYAPIHHLLLDADLPVLVMTSGNISGEPLVTDEDYAVARLGPLADLILSHDRDILVPCEDSVVTLDPTDASDATDPAGGVIPIRRSRGYAPLPVPLPGDGVVLAAGAEVKNTAALTRDGWAFVSAHVGDLENLRTRRTLSEVAGDLVEFHDAIPQLVVADAHPGYASRAWAQDTADRYRVPLLTVQHHHAHLASLAAEHGRLDEPQLGLVLDGTGYGCDGTIWGGELLLLTDGGTRAERLGHLAPWPLPGGDSGVRSPARLAVAALLAAGIDPDPSLPCVRALDPARLRMLTSIVRGRTGWVATSSAGRLFDIVASLLDVRHDITYEAQAAIELQALAQRASAAPGVAASAAPDASAASDAPVTSPHARAALLPAARIAPHPDDDGRLVLDTAGLLRALVGHLAAGDRDQRAGCHAHAMTEPASDRRTDHHADQRTDVTADIRADLALAMHDWLAQGIADLAARAIATHGLPADLPVGLTGGCFQNRLLLARTRAALAQRGLAVRTHRIVPANDGGLSLGQAAVGLAHLTTTQTEKGGR